VGGAAGGEHDRTPQPQRIWGFIDELAAMHRLRFRIFKERLGWDVQVSSDLEVDEFDACHPVYLRRRGHGGRIQGCDRFLPITGPTMLRDMFRALLGREARRHPNAYPPVVSQQPPMNFTPG
jgi:acyl homoserine lactone synthase